MLDTLREAYEDSELMHASGSRSGSISTSRSGLPARSNTDAVASTRWDPAGAEKSGVGATVAVVAARKDARVEIDRACAMIGATALHVASDRDLARVDERSDVALALISVAELEWSPQALLTALRQRRVPRAVMIGPTFGTTAHLMALEVGFDEVWAAGTSVPFLAALIRSQVRRRGCHDELTRRTLAEKLNLAVDVSRFTCRYGDTDVTLNQSQIETLNLLLRRAPAVVPRIEIGLLIPEVRSGRRVESRVVDVHVSRLRRRLREQGVVGTHILCSRGVGYRIVETRPEDSKEMPAVGF